MRNGQLKPAYNVQIYTNDQFKSLYCLYPRILDARYSDEKNYLYTQGEEINAFFKYNYFHKEQFSKWMNDSFRSSNFYYNEKQDFFYCPLNNPCA